MIGITGHKGAGKSMLASYLEEEHGFERMAFADSLKEAAKIIFQLEDRHLYTREGKQEYLDRWETTPRDILQKFGTEVGRQIDSEVWIKSVEARMEEIPHDCVVIEDVRFVNEADMIHRHGGEVWGLFRPEAAPDWWEKVRDLGGDPEGHSSEVEMCQNWHEMVDTSFVNSSDKSTLFAMAEQQI